MTPQKPIFTPTVSFGNLIQTVVLIAGIVGGYTMLQARSEQNATQIAEVRTLFQALEIRTRGLEVARSRDDERFSNILQFMARIDSRLERIERGSND